MHTREIQLPELPDALDGLRIAHLTDLHVGELLQPDRLPDIMHAVNDIKADMIAVTGDLIDLKHDVLDAVVDALGTLDAPLGVHIVLGNHDHLEDGDVVVDHLRAAKLSLLMNEHLVAEVEGHLVTIAGIDFASRSRALAKNVVAAFRGAPRRDRDKLRLLLAHHPHAFDAACKRGVDLTLAGHTHGGQLVLAQNTGKKGSLGLGNFGFKYPRGLYQRGHQYLYVNSGVGAWFPLRLQCPAEIACLILRRQIDMTQNHSHP